MANITIEDIPYQTNSEQLFDAVRDLPDAIWLDSGKPRSLQGCFDIISASPDRLIETHKLRSTISDRHGSSTTEQDPFALAKQLLEPLQPLDSATDAPFTCGLIGYFGYNLGRYVESIADLATTIADLPDMRIGRYLWSLVVNHQARQSHVYFHKTCPESLKQTVRARLAQANCEEPAKSGGFKLLQPFSASLSKSQYNRAIGRIKDYILSGDCYQTNYTQHFCTPYQGLLWDAYRSLRAACPAPYSVFWQWRNQAVLSLSPERFLKTAVEDNHPGVQVESKPIKGTVLRGASVEQDQENAIHLMNSSKDRAENLMIVDLLRNDLGKTCMTGSIRVAKLFALESFPNVHHLVSTITGTLRPDSSPIDLLRGCFPGGSITGAPKKRAMEIIEQLEPVKRSVYCGAVGYICASNRMDTNIAIRTLVADDNQLHCWGGGGIVADSKAEDEFEESMNKISLLLETLENTLED